MDHASSCSILACSTSIALDTVGLYQYSASSAAIVDRYILVMSVFHWSGEGQSQGTGDVVASP